MRQKERRFTDFLHENRKGVLASVITMLLGYGYLLTCVSISTDDTAFDMYFDFGYSLRMGRIVMTFLQKTLDLVEYTPFWIEFTAVLFLLAAAWRMAFVLSERTGGRLTERFIGAFVCVFVSFPLINEIFIYSSMSVSVGMGYFFAVYALELFFRFQEKKGGGRLLFAAWAFLAGAVSLYESFIPVFFCLTMCVLFLENRYQPMRPGMVVKRSLFSIGLGGAAVLGNTIFGQLCITIFGLRSLNVSANKSVVWTEQGIMGGIKSVLRTLFYDQFVAGAEYLPVLIFGVSVLALLAAACLISVRQRSLSSVLCFAGIWITAELIVFLQGQTYYRSCQAFALIVALAAALCAEKLYLAGFSKVSAAVLLILILVQTQDLSRWFYLENQCSEAESNLASGLVIDLKKAGLEGKRIAFVYDMDETEAFDYYGSYTSISSASYIRKAANYLASKFEYTSTPQFLYELNRKHNQTNCLTTYLEYGVNAFQGGIGGPNYELKKYLKPYFFTFEQVTWEEWEEAKETAEDMQSYPSDSCWKDTGDYIVVKVGI